MNVEATQVWADTNVYLKINPAYTFKFATRTTHCQHSPIRQRHQIHACIVGEEILFGDDPSKAFQPMLDAAFVLEGGSKTPELQSASCLEMPMNGAHHNQVCKTCKKRHDCCFSCHTLASAPFWNQNRLVLAHMFLKHTKDDTLIVSVPESVQSSRQSRLFCWSLVRPTSTERK